MTGDDIETYYELSLSEAVEADVPDERMDRLQNKIVLGTKDSCEMLIGRKPKTVAGGHEVLDNNPLFCLECVALFPTQSTFDAHCSSEHLRRTIKSEIDQDESKKNDYDQIYVKCSICACYFKRLQSFYSHCHNQHHSDNLEPVYEGFDGNCPFCSETFSNIPSYVKHVYSSHSQVHKTGRGDRPDGQRVRVNVAKKSTTKSIAIPRANRKVRSPAENVGLHSAVGNVGTDTLVESSGDGAGLGESTQRRAQPGETLRKCPICGAYFKTLTRYLRHCQKFHKAEYLTPIREVFSGRCRCGERFSKLARLASHIFRVHYDLYRKIATDIQEFYCALCELTFTSVEALREHKAGHDYSKSNMVEVENNKSPLKLDKSTKRNSVVELIDPKRATVPVNEPQTIATDSSHHKTMDETAVMIPERAIFKCPFCRLHFYLPNAAFYHSLRCKETAPEVVCDTCFCGFKRRDIQKHRIQHQLFGSVRVIEVTREVFQRIALVCRSCTIYFSPKLSLKEHFLHCHSSRGIHCDTCQVMIPRSSIDNHRHRKKSKVIRIAFTSGYLGQFTSRSGTRQFEKVLYYCCLCESYSAHSDLRLHKHDRCKIYERFCICEACGLRFTDASYPKHKASHRVPYQLTDITFIDVRTGNKIAPIIPKWDKCEKECKVTYIANESGHTCHSNEAVVCRICNETYDQPAHEIHTKFHLYTSANATESEIMKRYLAMRSLWNIIYRCEACEVSFDNYDTVIEHCQDHLNGNGGVETAPCAECELRLPAASIGRHRALHCGADVEKTAFQILTFTYENLLDDSWFDVFDTVTEEQKTHILNKTVYNVQRGLRLELARDRPSLSTLYQCSVCESIVEDSALVDHVLEEGSCANERTFPCSKCELRFLTRESLSSHKSRHAAEEDARLITFNRREHFAINACLFKISRNASLKFVVCKECNALIKKDEIQSHMSCHSLETTEACPETGLEYRCVSSGVLLHVDPTPVLTLFKCPNCRCCFDSTCACKSHPCARQFKQRECPSCHHTFMASYLRSHMQRHRNPDATRGTYVVEYSLRSMRFNEERVMYKCKCNLLFARLLKLAQHQAVCSQDARGTACCCGLVVHRSSLRDHTTDHYNCSTIQSYIVVDVEFRTDKSLSENLLWICRRCNTCFPDFYTLCYHLKVAASENASDRSARPCKGSSGNNILHGEVSPNVEYTNLVDYDRLYATMVSVQELKQMRHPVGDEPTLGEVSDSSKASPFKCKQCILSFTTERQLKAHYVANHRSVASSSRSAELGDKLNMTIQTNKNNLMRPKKPLRTIYQCGKCELNYTMHIRLKNHLASHVNFSKRFAGHPCPECGLKFTLWTLAKHRAIHHKKLNLKLEDFEIRIYSGEHAYRVVQLKRTQAQEPGASATTAPHSRVTKQRPGASASVTSSKLFRCAECDVYFTSGTICYDHALNHRPLDSTMYIGCKFCGLQIYCECLGVHMKGHREGSLALDDLVVTEYRLVDGEVRVVPFTR